MGYRYTKYSSIGRQRKVNQDAIEIVEVDGGLLFILCDGMGGENGDEIASVIAIKSILSFFSSNSDNDYLDKLKTSILETNEFIHSHIEGKPELKKMATTMEIFFLKSNMAYLAHIGDSRIYHLKNGHLKQLTKDHSLVQKLLDEGFLTVKEAENHPQKNIVLKVIGDKRFIEADLLKLKLNEYDKNKFFICSDGVTSLLSNKEIADILNKSNCEKISKNLSSIIRHRGAADDFSFIYIEND